MSKTPKGKAEQISIIEHEGTSTRVMNWNDYYVQIGSYRSPYFFNEIETRRTKNKSNIIIITGSPGEGKTYTGIRLAEIFDKRFDPSVQIVFSRPQLLHVIGEKSPLKRGQVILIDEAHYGMGSRRWMENVQKDLMDALASVRSRGFIIIIVCLHLEMLDKIIRKYVLSFMIHMEDRGLSVAYRLYTPRFAKELYKERLGKMSLSLPDVELCDYPDCLMCKHRHACMTTRAIYERRKKRFVDESSKLAEARAKAQERIKMSDQDLVKVLNSFQDELVRNDKGIISIASMQIIIERECSVVVGRHKALVLRDRYGITYPHIESIEN